MTRNPSPDPASPAHGSELVSIDPAWVLLNALIRDVAHRRAPLPALDRAALTFELMREARSRRARS